MTTGDQRDPCYEKYCKFTEDNIGTWQNYIHGNEGGESKVQDRTGISKLPLLRGCSPLRDSYNERPSHSEVM